MKLNIKLNTFLMVFISPLLLQAQDRIGLEDLNGKNIGVKLGSNVYEIYGDGLSHQSDVGSVFSVLLQWPLNSSWEVEGGIGFTQMNSTILGDSSLGIEDTKLKIKTFEIPIWTRFYFSKKEDEVFNWYAKAGGTVNYILSAKSKTKGLGETDVKSEFHRFGALFQLGLGSDINFMGGKISIDLLHSRNLHKFFKNSKGHVSGYILAGTYSIQI